MSFLSEKLAALQMAPPGKEYGLGVLPWAYIDGKIVFVKEIHNEIFDSFVDKEMELVDDMERSQMKAWEKFRKMWRGRYDPHTNQISIMQVDPDGSKPPPELEPLLEKAFPNQRGMAVYAQNSWKYKANPYLIKIAQVLDNSKTPYHKETYTRTIADVNRYCADEYNLTVALLEKRNDYSVGIQVYNKQVGTAGYVQYWHYDKNLLKQAKKTFNDVKSVLDNVASYFEYEKPPMSLVTPMIRSAMISIDYEKKEQSGVYHYNWKTELPFVDDWRFSLYGERYPEHIAKTMDVNWNVDEKSKEIFTDGKNSRMQQMQYKEAKIDWNIFAQMGKHWGITGAALLTFAAWAAQSGKNPVQIQQQVETQAREMYIEPAQVVEEMIGGYTTIDQGEPLMNENINNFESPQQSPEEDQNTLVKIIEQVESSGDSNAIGDNGAAAGILQIHKVLVDDVNRILREQRYSYDDRFDIQKSEEMFQIYTKHYSPNASPEVIARRWNGGPKGDAKKATLPYWEKVKLRLNPKPLLASTKLAFNWSDLKNVAKALIVKGYYPNQIISHITQEYLPPGEKIKPELARWIASQFNSIRSGSSNKNQKDVWSYNFMSVPS